MIVWLDDVVPLGVKLVTMDGQRFELGVCDSDLVWVGALVEPGVDLEPGAGRGRIQSVVATLDGEELRWESSVGGRIGLVGRR